MFFFESSLPIFGFWSHCTPQNLWYRRGNHILEMEISCDYGPSRGFSKASKLAAENLRLEWLLHNWRWLTPGSGGWWPRTSWFDMVKGNLELLSTVIFHSGCVNDYSDERKWQHLIMIRLEVREFCFFLREVWIRIWKMVSVGATSEIWEGTHW